MAAQRGAGRQLGLRLGEHPLEPQDERVVAAPAKLGASLAAIHLLQGSVERGTAHGSRGQRHGGVFAIVQQRLPAPSPLYVRGRFKVGLEALCHQCGDRQVFGAPMLGDTGGQF